MQAVYPLSTRVRCLVDADCFFVSCERLRDPSLLAKPVCVGGPIVVAVSYEAKAYSVRVGTPLREAKQLLPKEAVFCKPDFAWYKYVSAQLAARCQEITPRILQASIDEVYLDITDTKPPQMDRPQWCTHIQQHLIASTGIPLTLGCAPTPLLAKLFSTLHKPQGCGVALQSTAINQLLADCPLEKVSGIWRKTLPKVQSTPTALSYMQLPLSTIKSRFGLAWQQIRHGLRGHALATHLSPPQAPKSISSSRSFTRATSLSESLLREHLLWHREKVFMDLITNNLQTQHLRIALRDNALHWHSYEAHLPAYTQDKNILQSYFKQLLTTHYQAGKLYKGTGIWVGSLIQSARYTPWLFSDSTEHQKTLSTCMTRINQKRGKKLIHPARLHYQKKNLTQ